MRPHMMHAMSVRFTSRSSKRRTTPVPTCSVPVTVSNAARARKPHCDIDCIRGMFKVKRKYKILSKREREREREEETTNLDASEHLFTKTWW